MDQATYYSRQFRGSHFNADINTYAMGRNDFIVKEIISRVFKGQSIRDAQVVELSIGGGDLTCGLLENIPDVNLTCVDIDPLRIEYVKKEINRKYPMFLMKTEFLEINFDLQFDKLISAKYDVVIALDILEHVFDVFGFIENCARLLKPGGVFFLRVPNIAYIKHRLGLLCGKMPVTASWFGTPNSIKEWKEKHGWDGGHLHFFTIPLLRQLLHEYSFEVLSCKDPGASLSGLRNFWPTLFYGNPLLVARKPPK